MQVSALTCSFPLILVVSSVDFCGCLTARAVSRGLEKALTGTASAWHLALRWRQERLWSDEQWQVSALCASGGVREERELRKMKENENQVCCLT